MIEVDRVPLEWSVVEERGCLALVDGVGQCVRRGHGAELARHRRLLVVERGGAKRIAHCTNQDRCKKRQTGIARVVDKVRLALLRFGLLVGVVRLFPLGLVIFVHHEPKCKNTGKYNFSRAYMYGAHLRCKKLVGPKPASLQPVSDIC